MKTIYYVDLDENELVHWKYIKRVKLGNGKWRYYYDDSSLEKYKNQGDIAFGRSLNAAGRAYNYSSASQQGFGKNNKASRVHNQRQLTRAVSAQYSYVDQANRAYRRYRRQRITSFPARTISKGIVAVANWLSNSGRSKTIKKGC